MPTIELTPDNGLVHIEKHTDEPGFDIEDIVAISAKNVGLATEIAIINWRVEACLIYGETRNELIN